MKIYKSKPGHWLLLIRQGLFTLLAAAGRHLLPAPDKPTVILYGHQLSGNLSALYEEWQKSYSDRFDLYFLSLDPQYSQTLLSEGVRVLRCGSLSDMLKTGRSSAIITDHGLHAMSPLVRLTSILFIDVWHGIPFKGFVPDDFRVQHQYDEVWVSSPLLKEVYVHQYAFDEEKVIPNGYARVDKLFRREPPDPALKVRADIPEGHSIVLYAPTWQQDDKGRELFPFNQTQDNFIERLSSICQARETTLVIRSHINASIDSRSYDNVRYCSMKDFPDAEGLLMLADILICDWSSISFDYLALNRPTIFLDVPPPFKNGFSLDKRCRFGMVVSDMDELSTCLEQTLKNPESYSRQYSESHEAVTAAVYGENTDGYVADRQLNHLAELICRY
ncbi:MAG: CDP-glycerol glycerophosphotransferase family protein [Halioglobus sp.]|nr:CDP-glycerol glycerophosphotransferase family protein [Halioglobus sp.]